MLRKQNVTGISAIHYSLRDVDSCSGNGCSIVDVGHHIKRPTVNTHPELQLWMTLECLSDLQRTLCRCFRAVTKDQRHAVAAWQCNQVLLLFCAAELLARGNYLF